jgi:internalin A
MTPEEEHDYQEALRRIRLVEQSRAVELDLSRLHNLSQLPLELKRFTWIQTLNLSECEQLTGDLSTLAGLTSLRSLDLTDCWNLSDLSPLIGLPSLQSLNLYNRSELRDLSITPIA